MIWFSIYDSVERKFIRDLDTGRVFRTVCREHAEQTLQRARGAGLKGLEIRQVAER